MPSFQLLIPSTLSIPHPIEALPDNLRSTCNDIQKRVIELGIEKCFDRISHPTILENLIAPTGLKLGIYRCLKAGTKVGFPGQGTPQGGCVSPLLANIALDGIEEIHQSVRYADDMVIILKPQDDANEILAQVSQFLAAKGMQISEKKTHLTATTDGFDFLGWHFKVQNNGRFRYQRLAGSSPSLPVAVDLAVMPVRCSAWTHLVTDCLFCLIPQQV